MTNLLDILKEADLRTGFTRHFTSVATREALDRATLQKRLLLCLYGLGTNTGLKRVANGDHGESAAELLLLRAREAGGPSARNTRGFGATGSRRYDSGGALWPRTWCSLAANTPGAPWPRLTGALSGAN